MKRLRVGLMWASDLRHDYSTRSPEYLYRIVGHNTGNVAFVHAIQKLIRINCFVDWSASSVEDLDVLVFPAANQLGQHTNLEHLALNMSKRSKPIVVIGIGAQSTSMNEDPDLSLGTQQWLKLLIESAPTTNSNIWTRGEFSASQIKKWQPNGLVTSGTCPSLFINGSTTLGNALSTKPKVFSRVAVAAGNPGFKSMRNLEGDLVRMISDSMYPGVYITQSMGEMMQLGIDTRGELNEEDLERLNRFIAPWFSRSQFLLWCQSHVRSYFDAPSWMLELSRYDVVAGARFHGVALGLQAGVPGVLFAIDSRTAELGESSGYPTIDPISVSGIDRRLLEKTWAEFDSEAFDRNRIQKARSFYTFVVNNQLDPTDHLKALVGA